MVELWRYYWLRAPCQCTIRQALAPLHMQQKCKLASIDQLSILQSVKYNIPVSIWLPENYPNSPPIVYVKPALDMVIKTHHPFVDASGVVSSTYLQNWSQPHSTLMIMCNDISIQFGKDPPLFQKNPGWVPPAPAQHHHTSPQRQYPPERSQSPAVQQAPAHGHTFQAANPMVRSAIRLNTCLLCLRYPTFRVCLDLLCPWVRSFAISGASFAMRLQFN